MHFITIVYYFAASHLFHVAFLAFVITITFFFA